MADSRPWRASRISISSSRFQSEDKAISAWEGEVPGDRKGQLGVFQVFQVFQVLRALRDLRAG